MAGELSFVNETRAFARFVIEDKPDAKIGILYENDDYGDGPGAAACTEPRASCRTGDGARDEAGDLDRWRIH